MRDFDSAYRRYFPLIREKCRRMLGNGGEADDVAQETFIRLWQADLKDAGDARISGWIYRTSTRLAIDQLRERLRKGRSDEGAGALESLPLPAATDDRVAARRQLEWLARTVPRDDLEMAILSRLDRLTHVEIGEVLGISERTVRRRLQELERRLSELRGEESR